MRSILRKLDSGLQLTAEEYQSLTEYWHQLSVDSPESWHLFQRRYSTVMPYRNLAELDDFINCLCADPDLIDQWEDSILSFPLTLQPFLQALKYSADGRFKSWLQDLVKEGRPQELPMNRDKDIVIKYEEANPYKESGIKAHFDRLSRYPFISRLQTYRYLTRSKAVNDRIEYLQPDQLGGIFTNKEKSIYYYIYLTETDEHKAHYACSFLNKVFYGK